MPKVHENVCVCLCVCVHVRVCMRVFVICLLSPPPTLRRTQLETSAIHASNASNSLILSKENDTFYLKARLAEARQHLN
jgi:hypothetical protein